jgi:transposase-like protein
MTIDLTDPIFRDEDTARAHMEAIRWPNGPFCPHCGVTENIKRLEGKSHRPGLHQCNACRGHFTVTNGTVMERSHIPLTKWVLGFHLMAASKKGMSAHQLHRMLNVTYKTAWFMCHRIREAMREAAPTPLGGEGKIVEADEMYHGRRETPAQLSRGRVRKPTKKGTSGPAMKREVIGLVERGGEGRMIHVNHITAKNLREHVVTNASRQSKLHTDESRLYDSLGYEFKVHEAVHHASGEYARGKGDDLVTTNTVEGMFGVFKRGMTGVYQHCGEQHFQRYLDEFTFRWNNRSRLGVEDSQRAVMAIRGAEGKRLTYEGPASAKDA